MTRAHYVKKAQKDNPAVKKGEPYYWWKFRHGGKHYSATPPKPSQLTQSEFLSQMYELQERIEALTPNSDLPGEVESIVDDIRQLGEETQEKKDNMPDQLQEGDTGQLLEERVDAMESWASDLENVDMSEPESIEEWVDNDVRAETDTEDEDEAKRLRQEKYDAYVEAHWQEKLDEVQGCDPGI